MLNKVISVYKQIPEKTMPQRITKLPDLAVSNKIQDVTLAINAGSSSVKIAVHNTKGEIIAQVTCGEINNLEEGSIKFTYTDMNGNERKAVQPIINKGHKSSLLEVIRILEQNYKLNYIGVGHRVVHGGEIFKESVIIDDKVKKAIEDCSSLAPLHNPANLEAINVAMELFDCPHIAVPDTAFHTTIPEEASTYAIPEEIRAMGIKRYGFHGTSIRFVVEKASNILGLDNKNDQNMVIAHLGNGASISKIENGKSVDTSMGTTPLEGLVMGTRSGDIDAGALELIANKTGKSLSQIITMLNKESGLKGLCGTNNMVTIVNEAKKGSPKHILAMNVAAYRVAKKASGYLATTNNAQALIFTGGIGENAQDFINLVLDYMPMFKWEKRVTDLELNDIPGDAPLLQVDNAVVGVSDGLKGSANIWALSLSTDEELMISKDILNLTGYENSNN